MQNNSFNKSPFLFRQLSLGLLLILLHLSMASGFINPQQRVIAGYWHNFSNGSVDMLLNQIPDSYNVINVSFLENKPGSTFEVAFMPYTKAYPNEEAFISHVAGLKSQGKIVQISIGGQNGNVVLHNATEKKIFVEQTIAIIKKYGFNGIDIDLEGASIGSVTTTDFANPGNIQITLFNQAIDEILNTFGKDFWLTAAPEIYFVQDARVSYGAGIVGAYLPFLFHFHNRINVLYVQLYNSSNAWVENNGKSLQLTQNSADFMVFNCDLLLSGFVTANGTGPKFPAFRPDQIAIGKPATQQAAGSGYATPVDIAKAMHYLATGKSFGGAYTISKPEGYPSFRGVMTWSVNWDSTSNYLFAKTVYAELNSLSPTSIKNGKAHTEKLIYENPKKMLPWNFFWLNENKIFKANGQNIPLKN